jgi:hypothetical protein
MRARPSLLLAGLLALALGACKNAGGAPQPGAAGATATSAEDARYYEVTVAPVTLGKGASGTLRVVITPKGGLHWNEEFPTRLSVDAADTPLVHFTKTEVKKGDAEITVSATKDRAELTLPVAAKDAGEGTVAAKLSFSLCTDKTCHIFRNRDVQAAVTVR